MMAGVTRSGGWMMDDGWSGKGSRSRKDGVGECREPGTEKGESVAVEDDSGG
jgi:hypothetical protein